MPTTDAPERRLTTKGEATRAHIVRTAAELIYAKGVQNTSNDDVRKAAGVSGSQLSHYFPDKRSMVRAVISYRADALVGLHREAPLGELDRVAALHAWAQSYLNRDDDVLAGGCAFGSLVAEVMKSDLELHDDIAEGFERWTEMFRRGLTAMKESGLLRKDADPDRLAHVFMAAYQGGMLLAQGARDEAPLRDALNGALDYLETFVPRRRKTAE
jgi:TetR/AcrR family transcriptional regulator, transcriptional repressor for nem operon